MPLVLFVDGILKLKDEISEDFLDFSSSLPSSEFCWCFVLTSGPFSMLLIKPSACLFILRSDSSPMNKLDGRFNCDNSWFVALLHLKLDVNLKTNFDGLMDKNFWDADPARRLISKKRVCFVASVVVVLIFPSHFFFLPSRQFPSAISCDESFLCDDDNEVDVEFRLLIFHSNQKLSTTSFALSLLTGFLEHEGRGRNEYLKGSTFLFLVT